jgi:hypothetical protein
VDFDAVAEQALMIICIEVEETPEIAEVLYSLKQSSD